LNTETHLLGQKFYTEDLRGFGNLGDPKPENLWPGTYTVIFG